MSEGGFSYTSYRHHDGPRFPHNWNNWSSPPPPPPPLPITAPPPPPPPPQQPPLTPPPYHQNYPRNSPVHREYNNHNHNNHLSNGHLNVNNHNSYRPHPYTPRPTRPFYRKRPNLPEQYWIPYHPGNNYRRRMPPTNPQQLKSPKKKKKSLSQNIPSKKDWTIQDAQLALTTEKEHNKKSKHSLIIKFPDPELNKDIVANFNTSIENVHFQQPSTARFCFVTLKDSADPDEVIAELNKQTFGYGNLVAEYKKDKEEDQAVVAGDIDPLTLYVGNLAQDVTKEDMVNLYPTNRRIDIGYAKKMKFTRYAFVGFRTVADSVTAFKNTFNKQLHNKSLIVRFRRIHGTAGLPGEAKPQHPPKSKESPSTSSSVETFKPESDAGHSSPSMDGDDDYTDICEMMIDKPIKQEMEDDDYEDGHIEDTDMSYPRNRFAPHPVDPNYYLNLHNIKEEPSTDKGKAEGVDESKIKKEVRPIKMEPFDYACEDNTCYDGDDYLDEQYYDNECTENDPSDTTSTISKVYETLRAQQQRLQPFRSDID